jgi:IclR family transcriptional regulator, pca regulon regulatory protein
MTTSDDGENWQIASLMRGLKVLEAFDGTEPALSITEIAERAGISRAAARRIAMTLHHAGYLGRTPRNGYYLTPQVLALATAYLSAHRIGDSVQPILARLRQISGRSASVAVLEGHEIVYIARAASTGPMQIHIDVGQKLPAHATAMGRVLLAGLAEAELSKWLGELKLIPLRSTTLTDPDLLRAEVLRVRERGYCTVNGEIAEGIRVIAVPVRRQSGKIVAALNLTAQSTLERGEDDATQYLPDLQKAAAEIGLIWTYVYP